MKAGWEEARRGVQLEAGFEAWPRDEQSGRRPPWNGDAPGSRGLDSVSEGPRSKTDARSRDILVHQRRCLRFPARAGRKEMAGGGEGVGCPDVAAHECLPRGCGRAHGPQTTVSGGFHLRFPAPRIALGLTEFRVPTERAGLSAFISSYIYKECRLVCLGPWGLTRWNLPQIHS